MADGEDRKSEGRVTARVSHEFSSPPERVFDAWLDPESVRAWMGHALRAMGLPGEVRTIAIDPRAGGAFEFSDLRAEGEARHWGTYLALDRPRSLSFTWITDASEEDDPSVVRVAIRPAGAGCVVVVEHEFSDRWKEYIDRAESGWRRMLAGIAAGLGERPSP
ncbi:MAG: SRPBCC domain-containing protein [Planctomycetota bacterium]